MTALLWIPLLLPPALGAIAASRRRRRWTRALDLVAAGAVLAVGVSLALALRGREPMTAAGGLLRADALTAYMLVTIGAVAVTALWAALATPERPDGRFTALVCLFLAAMSLAVLADNLGVLWVAIEATTITTAFLVGHHRGRRPLEAAWKYVVLGSVGVAIAFLGIVLLYAAARAAGNPTLSWTAVVASAGRLDPAVTKLAVALAALGSRPRPGWHPCTAGYPTRMPRRPAPVSGLMSGVLLSVALYAILRIKALGDAVLGVGFMRSLLLTLGAPVARRRGGLLAHPARLQAAAGLLEHRAHGPDDRRGRASAGRWPPRPSSSTCSPTAWSRPAMFVQAGRILDARGQHPDRRRPRAHGAPARPGRRRSSPGPRRCSASLRSSCSSPRSPSSSPAGRRGSGWVMGAVLALLLLAFAGIGRHVLSMTLGPAAPGPGRDEGPPPGRVAAPAAGDRGPCADAVRSAGWRPGRSPAPVTAAVRPPSAAVCHDPAARHAGDRGDPRLRRGPGPRPDRRRVATGPDRRPRGRRPVPRRLRLPPPGRRPLRGHPGRSRATTPWIPTLAGRVYSAGRFEREIRDLYGIDPRRPSRSPTGWSGTVTGPRAGTPCSATPGPRPRFEPDVGSYPFGEVRGDGVYEIPVGPIHAGLIEPGHFRFSVVGETILRMKARLWFLHRGMEKLFEGRPPEPGIELAERISGDTAVGHTLAYLMAVEDAAGIEVADVVTARRALLLELERLLQPRRRPRRDRQRRRLRHRPRPHPAAARDPAPAQQDPHRAPAAPRRARARGAPTCARPPTWTCCTPSPTRSLTSSRSPWPLGRGRPLHRHRRAVQRGGGDDRHPRVCRAGLRPGCRRPARPPPGRPRPRLRHGPRARR